MHHYKASLLGQETHRRLNIVIDVQDSFSEMDVQTSEKFMKSFESGIASLNEVSKRECRASLMKFIADEGKNQETQLAYRKAIRDSIDALRARGVPTLYMTMGDSTELHLHTEPWSIKAAAVRDRAELSDLQLTGLSPRVDEDIFRKRFMSGFIDVADVIVSPEMEKYIINQRRNGERYKEAYFGRPTLLQHIRALGVESISIMGGMTEYCITDNALDAVRNGFRVTLLPDLVVPERHIIWDASPRHATNQTAKIKNKLGEIVSNPSSRGYKAAEAEALKAVLQRLEFRRFSEFISELDAAPNSSRPPNGVAEIPHRAPKPS